MFSAIFASVCFAACSALVLRVLYRRAHVRPLMAAKADETDWQAIFGSPVPAYVFSHEEPGRQEVSEGRDQVMSGGDEDMRVLLARLDEQVKSLGRENQQLAQNVEKGFNTLSINLGKNAEALQQAFANFRNDFVPKTEYATLAFQVKMLWGVATALGGLVLIMVARALFSGLTLG